MICKGSVTSVYCCTPVYVKKNTNNFNKAWTPDNTNENKDEQRVSLYAEIVAYII